MKLVCLNPAILVHQNDFSKSFMYSVHQMYFLVQKHLEQSLFKSKSISFSQFMILVGFHCSSELPVSQSLIAERLYLTEATVSRHVSTLVSLGLLSRTDDKENRRKHIIQITTKGKKVFESAQKIIDKELNSIFSVIKEKDRENIIKNFNGVLSALLIKK